MNLRYILWLPALLAIGQVVIGGEGKAKPTQSRSSKQGEIITVSYCDLVKNQSTYADKLVRVKATVLTWLDGTSLYDSRCSCEGIEPVFVCNDDEECSVMRKAMDQKTDFNGDVGRVEADLIGRLVVPLDTSTGKSRSKFMIKTIEQVTQISRDVPWLGDTEKIDPKSQ
jgi:hypothetical protein